MKIRQYKPKDKLYITNLIGHYRIALAKLKGSEKELDLKNAEEELEYYIEKNYPIYLAQGLGGNIVGFHVCRIQDDIVWSEALYVVPEERRKGVASALYEKAEIIAEKKGSNTVYNWVHPNNFRSIPFLKKRGYNVLNLIEVCKKRPKEKLTQKIKVGNFEFDY
ncbi:MAG: GNAT family N-acetyltransferase [Candidatus Thorarchaeota archaeon]